MTRDEERTLAAGILQELNTPRPDYVSKPWVLCDGVEATDAEKEAARETYIADLLRAKHIDAQQQIFLASEINKALRQS